MVILPTTGSGTRPTSVAVDDFNNDNCLGITVTNYDTNNITGLFQYGNGIFRDAIILLTGKYCRSKSVCVFDINTTDLFD